MIRVITAVLLVLLMHAGLLPARAQEAAGEALRVTTEFMLRQQLKTTAKIDPRILTSTEPPFVAGPAATHSEALLSRLTLTGLTTRATAQEAVNCDDLTRQACKTNGRAAFLVLGAPEFTGDTARVSVLYRTAKDPTAADSASVASSRNPERDLRYLSRPRAMLYAVLLVKRGDQWIVAKCTGVGGT